MTVFRSSVEAWRPLVMTLGNGKPIDFLLRWIDKESGGNACDYTKLFESGIFQLMRENLANVGSTEAAYHPTPPCQPGARSIVSYDTLTSDQQITQVQVGLNYVDRCVDKAQAVLAQYGYDAWTPDTTSFWSMVKMAHVAPARMPVMLAQGLACNAGVPPADWDALMFCGPFPNTPQSWTDNAGDVGSYATGLKAFGSWPTWVWVGLGIASAVAGVWAYGRYKDRLPVLSSVFHLSGAKPKRRKASLFG